MYTLIIETTATKYKGTFSNEKLNLIKEDTLRYASEHEHSFVRAEILKDEKVILVLEDYFWEPKEINVVVTRYDNDEDDVGYSETINIDANLIVKDLVRLLAKKFKANQKDFDFSSDLKLTKKLSEVREIMGFFYTRKDEAIDLFYSRN